jgi:hypothetical protein
MSMSDLFAESFCVSQHVELSLPRVPVAFAGSVVSWVRGYTRTWLVAVDKAGRIPIVLLASLLATPSRRVLAYQICLTGKVVI